jgi:hypothetical protein
MRDGNQPRLGPSSFSYSSSKHLAGVVDRSNAQPRALFRAQHLPGNDVGVMLQPGDDDLVVLLDVAPSPALRHQVDGLGGSADKDNLARGSGIEEAARLLAGRLVGVGCPRSQLMRGAMHVRVLVLVEVAEPVDDRLRLLRGRAVVEPDERAAVDDFAQDGKVAANRLHIEGVGREAEIGGNSGCSPTGATTGTPSNA